MVPFVILLQNSKYISQSLRPGRGSVGHPEDLKASRSILRPVEGSGGQPEGLGGQPEGLGGQPECLEACLGLGGGWRNIENQNLPVWYHRSSAPSGPLPN